MITSRSSKSSRVYYFSLIFCTHVLLISAYTTSVCGNHFSLFCCADINEKPSFGKHTGFFLMSTDSKRNTLKKSAHTAAGIFKENTFFFFFPSEFSYTSTDDLRNSRWRAMEIIFLFITFTRLQTWKRLDANYRELTFAHSQWLNWTQYLCYRRSSS